jgi:hypothetical protein
LRTSIDRSPKKKGKKVKTARRPLGTMTRIICCFLAVACGAPHHAPVAQVAPDKLVAFLPPAPQGWKAGKTQELTPEQSKMRPEASMAGRQYRFGNRSFGVAIVDPGWRTEVYAMYMSQRRADGSRHVQAPFATIGQWPVVERQYDEGDRELNVVVDRYIVSLTTRTEDEAFLRQVFESMDSKNLSKLD